MKDSFEWRVGLDGFVEGAGLRDVGDEDVVELGGVFGERREELLGFVFGADGDADGVAVGEEDFKGVCWGIIRP